MSGKPRFIMENHRKQNEKYKDLNRRLHLLQDEKKILEEALCQMQDQEENQTREMDAVVSESQMLGLLLIKKKGDLKSAYVEVNVQEAVLNQSAQDYCFFNGTVVLFKKTIRSIS